MSTQPGAEAGALPRQPSVTHLLARARAMEERVRVLVSHRRAGDPAPDDPFRGLYLSEEAVDALLAPARPAPRPAGSPARAAADALAAEQAAAGRPVRLLRLAHDARLSDVDVDLLLVALLPDLDGRFERFYGYLNDDVTRRRASVALALELVGASSRDAAARCRLRAGAPLLDAALVDVEDPDRPFLGRGLRVPDRVVAHLLGDDQPDPALTAVTTSVTAYGGPAAEGLAEALRRGVRLGYVREREPGCGPALAAAALALVGRSTVALDLRRLADDPDPLGVVVVAGREALLRGGGVVAAPVEALASARPDAMRRLTALPVPVLLAGGAPWDPTWAEAVPLLLDAPALDRAARVALWRRELDGLPGGQGAEAAAAHFVLGPDQVRRAVVGAVLAARADGGRVTAEGLRAGARAQNSAGLDRLARRVEPEVGWDDLVLPPHVLGGLHELANRARHRDLVLGQWRMRPGGGRGRGVTALFAGDSGTGKTMSAEVIAADLGLDLYTVDLASVVDKYVGETEKNLERIFREASGVNAVLLFDEADAVFGKRSEVRDAHDRYANVESAYLLQRMESFDGLAVLATNLRANIDEAFTRRLDAIVDFPTPDEQLRLALWQRCLAPPLPLGDDVDLAFCAGSFELTGGNIRSAAVTAAYLAAAGDGRVGMSEVIQAVVQEYRKLGRLVLEREFGHHLPART